MKKTDMRTLLCAIAMGLSTITSANAKLTVFHPTPNDLSELPHEQYFTWGINFNPAADETITGATLTFTNIWDWTVEKNDHLFIHLLDNPKSGLRSYVDNQNGGDNFAGQGILVGNWSDPVGGHSRGFNLVYDFNSLGILETLKNYVDTAPRRGRDNIGFGIDPDCHFYNSGVTFTITTSTSIPPGPVPEPATLGLLALGSLALIRRKK